MKTLRQWLDGEGSKPRDFAEKVGVHEITVYKWMQGKARPSFGKLVEIERLTRGQVTARSVASANPKQRKPKVPGVQREAV